MCLKTALALLCLLGATEYAKTAPVDDKSIANLAMNKYDYAMLNASSMLDNVPKSS